MAEPGSASVNGGHTERGHIREVVYAGMVTRYFVDLDQGGELQVVRQNLETSSSEALDAKGKTVLLEWSPEHMLEIETDSGEKEGEA
jgi:ABC-type Fe3+/spermidine/putrescine transport system ATPase subunit